MTEHANCGHEHTMPEEMICDRCKGSIKGKELYGMLAVILSSPVMPRDSEPFLLCFECGQFIANELCPELATDEMYQQAMVIGGIMQATDAKEKTDGLEG